MAAKRNNNRFARERDEAAWRFLDVHPATYVELVQASCYPTVEKARERISTAVRRGNVDFIGLVQDEEGYEVKLFSRFPVSKPQHEYEVTALILAAKHPSLELLVRRGPDVDAYLSDAELIIGGQLKRLERDRGTERGKVKLSDRFRKYDGCPDHVLWVMDSDTRINHAIKTCRPGPSHWFTTYDQAINDFYGDIWVNAATHTPTAAPTNTVTRPSMRP